MRKENACALSPISPFFWLLAGLAALRAANRWQIRETPEKPKEQSSAFRALLCVGDAPGLSPCPGKQEPGAGPHPERTACVRGSNADTNTVRDLPGAAARLARRRRRSPAWACTRKKPRACAAQMQTQTRCATCPAQPRVRARRGEERDTVRDLPTAGVLAAGAGFLPARENRSSARARTRKEPRACAAQMQTQTRCATCPAQPRACETRGGKRHGARLAHRRWGGARLSSAGVT